MAKTPSTKPAEPEDEGLYILSKLPCKFCDNDFQQTRPWQEFCCNEHRTKYHNSNNLEILRKARAAAKAKAVKK
jgi:hypothetical protein